LTLVLTLIMIIISTFIFVGQYHQKLIEFRELENKNNEQLINNSNNLSSVASQQQTIHLSPIRMELIAEGGIKHLPKMFRVSTFQIYEPEFVSTENNFMNRFTNIDWTFIIAFLLSFFAILLTYDAATGEKSDGTLRLLLSHSVSRSKVILSKYLSALVTITIPLVMGIILSLLIAALFGSIAFSSLEIFKILIYIVAALFYLSIFMLFGLLVTSLTKNSVTSIIILLFIWVISAILIPNSGGKIAAKFFQISTREEIDRMISDKGSEISDAHRAEYEKTFWWNGDPRAEWVPYRCRVVNAIAEARNQVNHNYMNQRINQIKKAKSILKISPTTVFSSLSEQICTTGLDHFEYFYQQIVDYRNQFRQFITETDKADPDSPHQIYEWESSPMSQKPVDSNAIPRFQEKELSLIKTIKRALSNFAVLIIFNAILFIAVFVAFGRYDVR
jgi:ABC-type transport system involved in multi-copper enzyme maturation permease subunit